MVTKNRLTRRDTLKGLSLLAGGAMLGLVRSQRIAAEGGQIATQGQKPWYELGVIGDPVMEEQLLFYLAHTWDGLSDIGECLDTASRIQADDLSTWPREWSKTADRIRGMADQSLAAGHKVSAGQAYLRAANYYRAALMHHADPKDPAIRRLSRMSMDCQARGIELLELPAQWVKIPYEGTALPAWFWRSPAAKGKAPVLIVHEGRDAWPEETKYVADACMKRGYHCLQLHGPGQGMALRELGLPFRPDWEKVITPVVDFLIDTPGVDPDRIALMGFSMGGALAPRAVAFEKRIKICIANPGVLNWSESISNYLMAASPDLAAALEKVDTEPQAFNAMIEEFVKVSPSMQWGMTDEMWKHGAQSPADLIVKLREFNNEPIVDRITCQVLVMDSEAEAWSAGQAKKLYDALKCPKDYMLFTAEDTGLVHCQTGAFAVATHRLFDWLEEHI